MSKYLLETINLKKSFDHRNGRIDLFNNVNIKVKKGELIASRKYYWNTFLVKNLI